LFIETRQIFMAMIFFLNGIKKPTIVFEKNMYIIKRYNILRVLTWGT
jgi:hypothetical protein